ncbi:MAG: TldD/PmbA family protein [Psychrilyobacter sp.]|uniref:TldD/PmbA family protein n=1 Tax=Psychrilyobacter sp. TaxID=2586924 RepID=UPI003C77FEC7
MNYTNLFNRAKEKNIEELEIYFSRKSSTSIQLFDSEVEEYKVSDVSGISLKGKYNGKLGFVYTEEISEERVLNLLDQLILNASIIETSEEFSLFEGSKNYPEVKTFNEGIRNIKTSTKIELLKKIEKKIRSYENIDTLEEIVFIETESETKIINSKNLNLEKMNNSILIYCDVVAKKEDEITTNRDFILTNDIDSIDIEKFAELVALNATNKLGGGKVNSGKYKALLSNEIVADLLEVMSTSFSAENVQKGMSRLEGKLETSIFSENITITDKPLVDFAPRSTPFDDEGVAASNKIIVKNGILKTFLHNRKTAKKDGIESTGNGFKAGFKGLVNVKPTNFSIENGKLSLEQLITKVGNGVYIDDLSGIHAGLNPVTGDFSLQAEGFLVKDGKLSKPINLITIAGNFFEILKDVNDLGNDFKYSRSGVGAPSLFINELSISGK